MAWIESHTVLIDHRKLKALAKELRLRPVYVLGHLHALWHEILEQQEDGDLSSWDDDSIAAAAQYTTDAQRFVHALRKHRWLDTNLVHDWLDYAGLYLTRKYATRNRGRLLEIWSKHGRTYGEGGRKPPDPVVTHAANPALQQLLAPDLTNLPTKPTGGSEGEATKAVDAGTLAASFLFYRKGYRSRGEQDSAIGYFQDLLRLGHSGEFLAAEITREDRPRGEPAWDFSKRVSKIPPQKPAVDINDPKVREKIARSEAELIERGNQ